MSKLRVAVVGCGNVSGGHIRAWRDEAGRAEIVALVDVAQEFAEKRKAEFGLEASAIHTDIQQALSRGDVDVVDICTPSHLHAEQIAAALEAGKHVITEKPTGYTLEECRRLRWHAARRPDLKVAVAYSLR
ncbi:MAG: Gfo/Idh/MocA family oxidoreductase, partial [Planctomycetes bacterium]|nr:Gfo/Idh/MocA family oxidoreductase [Planctomycetota bacterium]